MKTIRFDIPIYNCNIIYKVTNDFLSYMRKKGVELELDINKCKGICIPINSKHEIYILINKDRYEYGTVAHECLHATNKILKARGVKVSLKNDEAQTYLLGYIINRVL